MNGDITRCVEQSRHKLGFELTPANFFDRNPALDLRRAPFEVVR